MYSGAVGEVLYREDICMKSWTYAINSYYKTAHISLQTAPWPIFAIERITEFICDIIPPLPLPDIKFRLRDKFSIECNDGQEWTTIREWYGDLSQLFHSMIHIPVFDFCRNKIKDKRIDFDYDKLKEMFYKENKEFWDESERN